MFGTPFYHRTIRNYVIVFGTLFNDINLLRYNSSGNVKEIVKVPISYGSKEKYYTRLVRSQETQHHISIKLPRLSFNITGLEYDPTRKLNSVFKNKLISTSDSEIKKLFNPVPYNFNFELALLSGTYEDATNVFEQILPFFVPDYTVTAKVLNKINLSIDIPIILNNITINEQSEGSFEDLRVLEWTADFTVKGYLYPPIKDASDLIKKIYLTYNLQEGEQTYLKEGILLEDTSPSSKNRILSENDDTLFLETSTLESKKVYDFEVLAKGNTPDFGYSETLTSYI